MAPVSIAVERVSKRFAHAVKGELYAVRDVSLEVAPGMLLTLLGPSGCGKTTTLRMIAGFEEPDGGRILIDGQDVTGAMANKRGIGFVFQNYALFPHLTVFENVAYGLRVQGMNRAAIAPAVSEVLEIVGLAGYERQQPHQLSGGEQQRVALARAIVFQPRVLLFDEPLSNLDAKLRVQMRGEIQTLQKRLGITAVYVTHDQEEAMAISDRIAVMDRGVIVQEGSAEDLYYRPTSEFVAKFIGRTNLLSARVIGSADGLVELEVMEQRLRMSVGKPFSPGDRVRLVVRPETIELTPAAAGAAGAGKIVARTFLGERIDCQVAVGSALLQVSFTDRVLDGAMRIGDAVAVRLRPEGVHILRKETS